MAPLRAAAARRLALLALVQPAALLRSTPRLAARPVAAVRMMAGEAATAGRKSAAVAQGEKGGGGAGRGALDLNPPRGTRDFYPEEMELRTWLFDAWRREAQLHGFEEYDAPVLEKEELYKRKAGEEIVQQMYNFVDKDGKAVTLRVATLGLQPSTSCPALAA